MEGIQMPRDHSSPHRFDLARTVRFLAMLVAVSACTDRSEPTDSVNASIRSRQTMLLTTRDSSLFVGDTATILIDGMKPPISDGLQSIFVFRSSDSTTMSVNPSGIVRARRAGNATITVRSAMSTATLAMSTVSGGSQPPDAPPGTPPQGPGELPGYAVPQLPARTVNIAPLAPATRTVRVPAGDGTALQRALNAAVGGDEIVLADGATYTGAFRLPNRADRGTVVLRSETLPVPARTRMTPGNAGRLATLVTNSVFPALTTEEGAHGWRVVGVGIRLADGAIDNYGIVTIGSGIESSVTQFPQDIVLDRVAITGSTTGNTSRCLSLNGISLAIIDSWLSECHARGRDAQAVAAWTGSGPLLIDNNYLEGSGQAILLGGSDPRIANLTPSDITIRRNHLFKPLNWAGRWTVKAALELKHAERVLFEANVIENHWSDAQVGFAVLFQAISQDNTAPWSTVRDITVRLNSIRNSRSGVNILSRVSPPGTPLLPPSKRILFRDNSFESVGRDPITGQPGRFIQLLGDIEDATVLQNTFYGVGASNAVIFDGAPLVRLVLASNVFAAATYGVIGSGAGEGSASLQQFAPGSIFRGNLLTGLVERIYPLGNAFPRTLSLSDFVDPGNGNYALGPETGLVAIGGTRTGVDGSAVALATAGVRAR
jgi:hypothetical protein